MHILPEHYPIVGGHLIGTLKELLPEQFTAEVEYAWREAYALLADICITEEAALYEHSKTKHANNDEYIKCASFHFPTLLITLMTRFILLVLIYFSFITWIGAGSAVIVCSVITNVC